MAILSLVEVLARDVKYVNVADLFEAPEDPGTRKTHVRQHAIATVDTTLSRKKRIRKPSERMKNYRRSGKKSANVHSSTTSQTTTPEQFLWCNEDASFIFHLGQC